MEHRIRMRAIALAVSSTLILAACGGGGSSNHSVSGIAAEGLAIANAVVTIKDATGATRSVTTDASGNYVFDTSGLSYPLMLQVTGTKGVWHALVIGPLEQQRRRLGRRLLEASLEFLDETRT